MTEEFQNNSTEFQNNSKFAGEKHREQVLWKISELSEFIENSLCEIQEDQEKFWNSFSRDEQLMLFCSVVRRIHSGEIQENRSYRGVLYTTFGFGPEAYTQAQHAGYLDIHNRLIKE